MLRTVFWNFLYAKKVPHIDEHSHARHRGRWGNTSSSTTIVQQKSRKHSFFSSFCPRESDCFSFLYISHSKRYTRVKRWSGKTQPSSTDVHVHVHLQTPPSFPSVSSSPHHTTTAKPVVAENLQTPSLISPTNYSCGNIRAGTCLLAF
jgi:hypothetical protein